MSLIIPTSVLLILSIWYITNPIMTEAENNTNFVISEDSIQQPTNEQYIVVHLDTNKLELHNKSTTTIMELVSQGKPGSYYETIGGVYTSDYKEPLHFSSIGHVYMPYSVHLFGNYFIHGIPYYPDGTRVSSAYSGGCVRLNDNDAKTVYDFVTSSTTIIITRGEKDDFTPTKISTTTISSIKMTRLMSAIISLEFLNQDNEVKNIANNSTTSRLEIIPHVINNTKIDTSVIYKDVMTNEAFVQVMNKKAESLGLTNTMFTGVNTSVITTEEDYGRFMSHIITYKSYLITASSF